MKISTVVVCVLAGLLLGAVAGMAFGANNAITLISWGLVFAVAAAVAVAGSRIYGDIRSQRR